MFAICLESPSEDLLIIDPSGVLEQFGLWILESPLIKGIVARCTLYVVFEVKTFSFAMDCTESSIVLKYRKLERQKSFAPNAFVQIFFYCT